MNLIEADELYRKFQEQLVSEKLIESIEDIDFEPKLEPELFETWLNEPLELKLDDRGQLVTLSEGGEETRVFDPRGEESIPEITKYIPVCPFDTQCGGVISQQQEARAIWKVSLINKVSKDVYSDEIEKIKSDYDFSTFKNSKGEMPFFELLGRIQQSKNLVISMFLSAINVKLAEDVEKKEAPYIGFASETEATELDELRREVSVLNYDQMVDVKKRKDAYQTSYGYEWLQK